MLVDMCGPQYSSKFSIKFHLNFLIIKCVCGTVCRGREMCQVGESSFVSGHGLCNTVSGWNDTPWQYCYGCVSIITSDNSAINTKHERTAATPSYAKHNMILTTIWFSYVELSGGCQCFRSYRYHFGAILSFFLILCVSLLVFSCWRCWRASHDRLRIELKPIWRETQCHCNFSLFHASRRNRQQTLVRSMFPRRKSCSLFDKSCVSFMHTICDMFIVNAFLWFMCTRQPQPHIQHPHISTRRTHLALCHLCLGRHIMSREKYYPDSYFILRYSVDVPVWIYLAHVPRQSEREMNYALHRNWLRP